MDGILRDSSGQGNDAVLGGPARDMLAGPFAYTGSRQGGSLDDHAEALRQVVSEWSAMGLAARLDGSPVAGGSGPAPTDLWPRTGDGLDGVVLGTTLADAEA